jgi:hypothetical protein
MAQTPRKWKERKLPEGITRKTGREIMTAIFGPEAVAELDRLANPDTEAKQADESSIQ